MCEVAVPKLRDGVDAEDVLPPNELYLAVEKEAVYGFEVKVRYWTFKDTDDPLNLSQDPRHMMFNEMRRQGTVEPLGRMKMPRKTGRKKYVDIEGEDVDPDEVENDRVKKLFLQLVKKGNMERVEELFKVSPMHLHSAKAALDDEQTKLPLKTG